MFSIQRSKTNNFRGDRMRKETKEIIEFLDKLKEALYQTRYYYNNKITELAQRIENFKSKLIMESWMDECSENRCRCKNG
jgi:type IV secretory pathway VirB4 component